MSSITKYWAILEALQFPEIGVPESTSPHKEERIRLNVEIIQKEIQLTPMQVTEYLIRDLELHHIDSASTDINEETDFKYLYTIYLLHVMRSICNGVDFNNSNGNGLVSEKHRSLGISCIGDIVENGLKLNLHSSFYSSKKSVFYHNSSSAKTNFYRTELLVASFSPLVHIQTLYTTQTMEDMTLSYMAGIFSLLFVSEAKEYKMGQTQVSAIRTYLQRIWTEVSKRAYYRNLMLFYAMLPADKQQRIHKDMLLKLWSSGGFIALLYAMLESRENEGKHVSQVVCKLVAQHSFPAKAQHSLVKQILQFVVACSSNAELMPHMGVGLLSLRELCKTKSENKDMVRMWLRQQMKQLLEIEEEVVTVLELRAFTELISLLFQMFCTSNIECLPSELLLPYSPLLIACHMQIQLCGKQDQVIGHLSSLILNILNNRQKDELESIVKFIALNKHPQGWLHLHPKIVIEENPLCTSELRIVQKETEPNDIVNHSSLMFTLAVILKESSFNILSFNVFMTLFRLIPSLDINGKSCKVPTNTNLLMTDDELEDSGLRELLQAYEFKMDVIKSLELLLYDKTLRTLINENISEILKVLQDFLIVCSSPFHQSEKLSLDESVIMVLLVLISEIVEGCSSSKLEEVKRVLLTPLMRLETDVKSGTTKYKIASLLKKIRGETSQVYIDGSSEAAFVEARSLLESGEPFQHVQGIEKLIRLIDTKDEFILSNVHIITTLALNTLKSAESYTFLNCVRLFVALVNVNAPEVLDILIDEYSNESASKDYRLVVGEALLKVCKQLGPLCYNYQALLLNCYLCGCRSALDEFRFSAFSNLGQMCRILSYKVQSFFQELLHLIDCELTTGKYLPAKRAAVMVLSDLLGGMDNLYDYEEMLLPIYRLLKHLASSGNVDEKIRLHAAIGLENLSAKCKELISASIQRPLEKQIEIMGIGDKPKRKLKDHILWMN